MATIEVNVKTCAHDGKCVQVCPIKILQMNTTTRVPEFVEGGAEACINCGHCFAVCPPGSLQLSGADAATFPRLDHAKLPGAEAVELFLKGRRSVRAYKEEPVSRETMEKLIDIARYAPSGINRQPVNWAVIIGKDTVHDFGDLIAQWIEGLLNANDPMAVAFRFEHLVQAWKKGEDLICRGAPCIVIAYGLKDDPMVPQSCTIAATYLELAAAGLGLGACWAGYASMAINASAKVREFTGLSHRAAAGGVMMIGHPKYRYSRIPARNAARIMWK
ncbi:MAG: nitroreductase family protein [Candidatus Omnitrophota bacterium]